MRQIFDFQDRQAAVRGGRLSAQSSHSTLRIADICNFARSELVDTTGYAQCTRSRVPQYSPPSGLIGEADHCGRR